LADKALTRQWLEVESQNFTPALQPIFYQLFVCPMRGLPVDLSVVEANLPKFAKVLDIYEERLGKTPYLAGEFFSLADLSHLPFLQNIVPKPELAHLFQSRKNVWAWWERISQRPAWKKVVAFANA
jgi:glutathione S-transferase